MGVLSSQLLVNCFEELSELGSGRLEDVSEPREPIR